jgi:hypothetical protein
MSIDIQRYTVTPAHWQGHAHITDSEQGMQLHWQGNTEQAEAQVLRMNATPEAAYCCQCLQVIDRLHTRNERDKKYSYCGYCYLSQFD